MSQYLVHVDDERIQDLIDNGQGSEEYYRAYADYFGGSDFDVEDADDAYRSEGVNDLYTWYLNDHLPEMMIWVPEGGVEFEDVECALSDVGLRLSVDEIWVDQYYALSHGFVISTEV